MKYIKGHLMVGSIMVAVSALKPGAQYSAPLPYKPVTIQKVHGVSEFKGAFIDRTPGRPQMPWYMVSFLLPPDADITSVTARIINPVAKELSGPYTINPGRALRHENGRIFGQRAVSSWQARMLGSIEKTPSFLPII